MVALFLIPFAVLILTGWYLIFEELIKNKSIDMHKDKTTNTLMEWRIPFINRHVKAEFYFGMLVFNIIDRNSDQADEIGFWENGEWMFMMKSSDRDTTICRRIMILIMRRYPARISRLQKHLSKIK